MTDDGQKVSLAGKGALAVGAAFIAFGLYGVGLIIPTMHTAFALSPQLALVPWVATLVGPVFALCSPVAGSIIQKYGYRNVYIISILLFAFSGAAPLIISNLWVVLGLRVVLGFSIAGTMTASLAGIGDLPEAERPMLFGLQNTLASLLFVLALPLIGLMTHINWHLPFVVYLLGLLVLPLAMALPKTPLSHHATTSASDTTPKQGILAGFSLLLFLFAGTIGLSVYLGQIYVPVYLAGIGVTNPATASIAVTTMAFTTMAVASVYGYAHRWLGTSGTFIYVFGLIAIGLGLCGISTTLAGVTIGCFILGLAIGFATPNSFTWAMQNSNASAGHAGAYVNVSVYLPQALYPLIAPFIMAHGGPVMVFRVFAAIGLFWAIWFTVKTMRPLSEVEAARALRSGGHH